jgi:hypothetical protein
MDTAANGRRRLQLADLGALRAELDSLERAEADGRLRAVGAWTPGQVYGHLAAWINFAFDGYPPELDPPGWIKFFMRFAKKRFLRGPMKPGVRIPGITNGTLATEPLTSAVGLERLRAGIARLEREAPPRPHPIFGAMAHDEWMQANLRHAELHLSFLAPQTPEHA